MRIAGRNRGEYSEASRCRKHDEIDSSLFERGNAFDKASARSTLSHIEMRRDGIRRGTRRRHRMKCGDETRQISLIEIDLTISLQTKYAALYVATPLLQRVISDSCLKQKSTLLYKGFQIIRSRHRAASMRGRSREISSLPHFVSSRPDAAISCCFIDDQASSKQFYAERPSAGVDAESEYHEMICFRRISRPSPRAKRPATEGARKCACEVSAFCRAQLISFTPLKRLRRRATDMKERPASSNVVPLDPSSISLFPWSEF